MRFTIPALRLIAILVLTIVALIGILAMVEHTLVYHPHPYRADYRKLFGPGMVELVFKTNGNRQSAFYLPPAGAAKLPDNLWIAFCGNGSLALDWLPLLKQDRSGLNGFLLLDYLGYGQSEGWPNRENTRAAAEGALKSLGAHLGVNPNQLEPRLHLIGHSLGAAAALDFATFHSQVKEIILLAPFTSLRDEAALFIGRPLSRLLRENYDNRAALRQLAQRRPLPKVIIFHGLADDLIPASMGRELAGEFPRFVTFRSIPDATHDSIVLEASDQILSLLATNAEAAAAH
jgi:pimeloyl-ACP methyl ester carboxylesterase